MEKEYEKCPFCGKTTEILFAGEGALVSASHSRPPKNFIHKYYWLKCCSRRIKKVVCVKGETC
jgi:hypothetical protein